MTNTHTHVRACAHTHMHTHVHTHRHLYSIPFSQCSCFPGIVFPNKMLGKICFLQSLLSSGTLSVNIYSELFCMLIFVSRLAMSSSYSLHTLSSMS